MCLVRIPRAVQVSAPWSGFNYSPVRWIVDRIAARRARTERKNFLRYLRNASDPSTELGRELSILAQRLQRLHGIDWMSREEKQARFAEILDDYADLVVKKEPVPEDAADIV